MPQAQALRRPLRPQIGQSLVLVALMLPVLLGFLGFAADYGRLAAERRKLQNAADSAALAGGQDLSVYYSNATTDATTSLTTNGYTGAGNDAAPTITLSDTNSSGSQPPDTITVSLKRTVPMDFFALLGIKTENVTATAKAVVSSVTGCTDTGTSICVPYLGWNTVGSACTPIQKGDIIVFRDNAWKDTTNASSCNWGGNSNNFKGFLRPSTSTQITTGTNQIDSKGGNACGQEPVSEIQGAFTSGTDLIIPIGDSEIGNGANLSIDIPGFIAISLNFTYPYQGQFQTVTLNGSPTGGSFSLSFNGKATPATNQATQTLSVYGSPTGGSFALSYGGQTTAPIAYPATASTVQAALAALSTIGAGVGNVAVTSPSSGVYSVAFGGTLNLSTLSYVSPDPTYLTGGANTWIGVTGIALPYNATDKMLQAGLQALSTIGSGNVSIIGQPGGPWTVTFQGTLGTSNQSTMIWTSSLTGGSSPAVTVVALSTDTGREGTASQLGDYTCPNTWWAKIDNTSFGVGSTGGVTSNKPCLTSFYSCTIRLQ